MKPLTHTLNIFFLVLFTQTISVAQQLNKEISVNFINTKLEEVLKDIIIPYINWSKIYNFYKANQLTFFV